MVAGLARTERFVRPSTPLVMTINSVLSCRRVRAIFLASWVSSSVSAILFILSKVLIPLLRVGVYKRKKGESRSSPLLASLLLSVNVGGRQRFDRRGGRSLFGRANRLDL